MSISIPVVASGAADRNHIGFREAALSPVKPRYVFDAPFAATVGYPVFTGRQAWDRVFAIRVRHRTDCSHIGSAYPNAYGGVVGGGTLHRAAYLAAFFKLRVDFVLGSAHLDGYEVCSV